MSVSQCMDDVMKYIRERTQGLDDGQYADFLERLKYEIESLMELGCWEDPDE